MSEKYVVLFRGVGSKRKDTGRAGKWWSTSPWYAMRHKSSDGTLYVAEVEETELKRLAKDASIEGDFENYFFGNQDPPGAREATREEIDEYSKHEITSNPRPGHPGFLSHMVFVKKPENHVELGKKIFGKKSRN